MDFNPIMAKEIDLTLVKHSQLSKKLRRTQIYAFLYQTKFSYEPFVKISASQIM